MSFFWEKFCGATNAMGVFTLRSASVPVALRTLCAVCPLYQQRHNSDVPQLPFKHVYGSVLCPLQTRCYLWRYEHAAGNRPYVSMNWVSELTDYESILSACGLRRFLQGDTSQKMLATIGNYTRLQFWRYKRGIFCGVYLYTPYRSHNKLPFLFLTQR